MWFHTQFTFYLVYQGPRYEFHFDKMVRSKAEQSKVGKVQNWHNFQAFFLFECIKFAIYNIVEPIKRIRKYHDITPNTCTDKMTALQKCKTFSYIVLFTLHKVGRWICHCHINQSKLSTISKCNWVKMFYLFLFVSNNCHEIILLNVILSKVLSILFSFSKFLYSNKYSWCNSYVPIYGGVWNEYLII